MTRRLLFLLLLFAVPGLHGQEPATEDEAPPPAAEDKETPPPAPEGEAPPIESRGGADDVFVPSEEVRADASISFPVDI
jgi:hypothetical protein